MPLARVDETAAGGRFEFQFQCEGPLSRVWEGVVGESGGSIAGGIRCSSDFSGVSGGSVAGGNCCSSDFGGVSELVSGGLPAMRRLRRFDGVDGVGDCDRALLLPAIFRIEFKLVGLFVVIERRTDLLCEWNCMICTKTTGANLFEALQMCFHLSGEAL